MPLDFSITPSKAFGPLPQRTQRPVDVRVRFSYQVQGFREATDRLYYLLKRNDVMVRLVETAVVRSVVVNIRRRFLNNIEKALEMKVIKQGDRDVMFSPRERMRDVQLKRSLQRTLERLNEAQLAGDADAVDKLQARAIKAQNYLQDRLQQDKRGKVMRSHGLSTLAGNQFRRRMMAVLQLITDRDFVQGFKESGNVVVGIGPTMFLDKIETPSATSALTGMPTRSKYKKLWRQLEFGTGLRRSAAKDRLNEVGKPRSGWEYGRPKQRLSLFLEGTLPMNFLTTSSGQMFPNDVRDLDVQLTRALTGLLRQDLPQWEDS